VRGLKQISYLLMGTLLLFAAATAARPREPPVPYAVVGTWSALVLLLPLLYGDSVRSTGAGLASGLLVHSLALGLSAAGLVRALSLMRRDGERL
jgi:hypothetical protein